MPLTNYALDNFASQELSLLTECRAKEVGTAFPDREKWLTHFVMLRIFLAPIPDSSAALGFVLMRHADEAITAYDVGCTELARFVGGSRSLAIYFRAMARYESAIFHLYVAYDIARKVMGLSLFKSGDGSLWDRLNMLHNTIKHHDPMKLPQSHLHALWLRNDGVHMTGRSVTFGELRDAIHDLGGIADSVSNGRSPSSSPSTSSA